MRKEEKFDLLKKLERIGFKAAKEDKDRFLKEGKFILDLEKEKLTVDFENRFFKVDERNGDSRMFFDVELSRLTNVLIESQNAGAYAEY